MHDENYYKKSLSSFLYTLLPVIPLIVFLLITDTFYTSITHDKQEYKQCIEVLEKEREMAINTIIYNRMHQAKVQNYYIYDDLEERFRKKYNIRIDDGKELILAKNPSLDVLTLFGQVLIKDVTISKLYDTIEPDHVLLFSNTYGIIELNTSFSKAHLTEFRNWDAILQRKINKPLAADAIYKLVNNTENVIFWESSYSKSHAEKSTISTCCRDELDKMIRNTDLDLLHYYNLLIPTYISLDKNDESNKLIIIREINIHRIIEPYIYYINQYTTMMESYRHDMSKIIYIKVITCILISLALLVSFVLAVLSSFSEIYKIRGD